MPQLGMRSQLRQTLQRMDDENVYNRRHLRRIMRNPLMMQKLSQEFSRSVPVPQKFLGINDNATNRGALLKFLWENRAAIMDIVGQIISLFNKSAKGN